MIWPHIIDQSISIHPISTKQTVLPEMSLYQVFLSLAPAKKYKITIVHFSNFFPLSFILQTLTKRAYENRWWITPKCPKHFFPRIFFCLVFAQKKDSIVNHSGRCVSQQSSAIKNTTDSPVHFLLLCW
jgi:hypothetical protein